MPSLDTLVVFAATALLLCAVPGPNVLYIVSRTLSEGRRAGVASVLGIMSAGVMHVALAALGLSALLASSNAAYDAVRYAGAAYLVWLGVRALRARPGGSEAPAAPGGRAPDPAAAFRQGFLVNLLSPKTALIFLAVLPQFVVAGHGPVALQTLLLGFVLLTVGLLNDLLYALGAGALSSRLRRRPSMLGASQTLSGLVYIALGVGAALTGGRRDR